jgi:ribonuclease HI
MTNPTYLLYADGACSGNPGPGGFAWELWEDSVEDGNEVGAGAGGSIATTNNIMELRGAIAGLEAVRDGIIQGQIHSPITLNLHFDSKYVLDGMFSWIKNWKANNWKTAKKEPVKNRELWETLSDLIDDMAFRQVTLVKAWVKGHDESEGNIRVDAKAVIMRDLSIQDLKEQEAGIVAPEPKEPSESEMRAEALLAMAQMQDANTAPRPEAVALLTSLLAPYVSGDISVKAVLESLRQNASNLGL